MIDDADELASEPFAAPTPPDTAPPATTFFTTFQSTFPKAEEILFVVVHISLLIVWRISFVFSDA